LDSGVDKRFLVAVDPAARNPFGNAVGVETAGPAAGQKVVVVVNAEQGQIVEVGGSAVDLGNDVMPLAILRGSVAAGKAAAGISGVKGG